MTKGKVVARSITNMKPEGMTLKMECFEEPLTACQEAARLKLKREYDKVHFLTKNKTHNQKPFLLL